jgi:hypothetical protein
LKALQRRPTVGILSRLCVVCGVTWWIIAVGLYRHLGLTGDGILVLLYGVGLGLILLSFWLPGARTGEHRVSVGSLVGEFGWWFLTGLGFVAFYACAKY